MLNILQKIIEKTIAFIAVLIIGLGIIKTPASEYAAPPAEIPAKNALREIPPAEIIQENAASTSDKKTGTAEPPAQPGKNSQAAPAENIPIISEVPQISLTELNKKARSAVVNIFCTTKISGNFKPITGSGVVISEKGVILTSAHIGEYFLLENESLAGLIDCVVRDGDTAERAYDAKLLYLPSAWLLKNADAIIQQEPKGTGEDDYSLLLINSSLRLGKKLPSDFSYAESNFDFDYLPINLLTLIASYPAGLLGGISVQKNLGMVSTFAPVTALYTFAETGPTSLDIFSLGGNIAAQGGSSGGGVFDTRDGKLIGLIATATEGTTTAAKILNAITLPHIARSFEKYTGKKLADFLANNPDSSSEFFPETEFNRLKNILLEKLRLASN